jgi:adenine-specific DNA-methyltransferase
MVQDPSRGCGEQLNMLAANLRSLKPSDIPDHYRRNNPMTMFQGDCAELLREVKGREIQLIVTSPPYNIGKRYEQKVSLDDYLAEQEEVIALCAQRLSESGSICWQVGNHVQSGEIFPLDIMLYPIFRKNGLVLRNRVVWHFEHGLHCSRRLSGRYETILWFTWPGNRYRFDVNPIRIPQKYPGKRYYKGPRAGQFSANPLGKNPGDVWIIPNVKHNHVEKTAHPCQFPVELVERLVLSLTDANDLVFDPYMGSGSTGVAALRHGRRVAGADTVASYVNISKRRWIDTLNGTVRTRPMGREVYKPQGSVAQKPWTEDISRLSKLRL